MKNSKFKPRKASPIFTLVLIFLLLASGSVFAEDNKEVFVKEGRYLVSFIQQTGLQVRDRYIDRFVVAEKIGEFFVLEDLTVSQSQLTEEAKIVPYDSQSDLCASIRANDRNVRACSPSYVHKLMALPNDPYMSALWGLKNSLGGPDIGASAAWDLCVGSPSVVVAVLDTGVDYNHPDLQPNMWRNPGEIPGNGVDDDANGYVDDVYGINAVLANGNPTDTNLHGTHVAGTIGARGNNGLGVVGVAWNLQILAIGGGLPSGFPTESIVRGIDYIISQKRRGVNVVAVNASFGGGGESEIGNMAYQALRDAGIILVAAAGNDAENNDVVRSNPANLNFDNIVAVAALNSSGNLASFSNYGLVNVDIAAPGEEITSTLPGGGYSVLQGTSMAAPEVTGALALLAAYRPGLSYTQYIQILLDSAVQLPSLTGLVAGSRFLNIHKMLLLAGALYPLTPASPPVGTGGPNPATPVIQSVFDVSLIKAASAVTAADVAVTAVIKMKAGTDDAATMQVALNGQLCSSTPVHVNTSAPKRIRLRVPKLASKTLMRVSILNSQNSMTSTKSVNISARKGAAKASAASISRACTKIASSTRVN